MTHYHLIFANWRDAVVHHGEILDKLIRTQINVSSATSLLDCSCGIGTQAIGLALRGYRVHASDISAKAVERAKKEAQALNAPVTFSVADFRYLDKQVEGIYTVVLSCDNSLPHLLTDDDILMAIRSMRTKLEKDGLLLISIRDYDRIVREKPRVDLPRVFDSDEGRRIPFQVWDWDAAGIAYIVHHFIIKQAGTAWETLYHQTHYRALQRAELTHFLEEAGFNDIRWHMPHESAYFQPVVTVRKR